jgi:hypothetical protein
MTSYAWLNETPAAGPSSIPPSTSLWRPLTFGEFSSRMKREFGISSSVSGASLGGFQLRDQLGPSDIRWLCQQVGAPAEDFGVEP